MNKTIHYFWFGGAEKGKVIEKCIASWGEFFPDFEIKEWNESNFDIRQNKYISQAYDAKKYAFVSDFARFKILHEQGGLYFDTDVEVIKHFFEFFELDAFAAFETDEFVAPGIVLWAKEEQNEILSEILDVYSKLEFINPDGSSVHTTEMLALNIYDTFYGSGVAARGTAQAKAVLFFILVAGLGLLQLTSTRKKEVQQ